MKKRMSKVLAIILALALCIGVIPISIGATTYDYTLVLSDGVMYADIATVGNEVTVPGITWDATNAKWIFDGVNFVTSETCAVHIEDTVTIELKGTNTFVGASIEYEYEDITAFYVDGGLTIEGTGTLNVTSGNIVDDTDDDYYTEAIGVYGGDIIINSGTINATTGVSATASTYGIYAGYDCYINGGNVNIEAGTGTYCYGLYVEGGEVGVFKMTDGTLNITTGDAVHEYGDTYAIWVDEDFVAEGGTINATAGDAIDESYGIYVELDFVVTDGTVTATAGDGQYSTGIYACCCGENFEISGGTVAANSGAASYGDSYGFYIDYDAVISGGTVTANGGTSVEEYSYGMYVYGGLTVTGGTVTATGGTGYYGSYGIDITESFEVSDGVVNATAGAGDYTAGIYVENYFGDGDFIMTGGTVNAKGGASVSSASTGIYADSPIYIDGGNLTALGGISEEYIGYGLAAYGSIEIYGGNVVAKATEGENSGVAVEVIYEDSEPDDVNDNVVYIDGGDVIFAGGIGVIGQYDFDDEPYTAFTGNLIKVEAGENTDGTGAEEITAWLGDGTDITEDYKYMHFTLIDAAKTAEIKIEKTVVQGGTAAPNAQTFTFELFDFGVDELTEDDFEITGNTVTTNGANTYTTTLKFDIESLEMLGNLSEGFKLREKVGTAENWTYSDKVYFVVFNLDMTAWEIYEYTDDLFSSDEPPVALEKATFINTYTAQQVVEDDDIDDNLDDDLEDNVETGDSNAVVTCLTVLAFAAVAYCVTLFVAKRKEEQ